MTHLYEHMRGLDAEIDNVYNALEAEHQRWAAYYDSVTDANGKLKIPKRLFFKEQGKSSKLTYELEGALCRLEDKYIPDNPFRCLDMTDSSRGETTESYHARVRAAIALAQLIEVPFQCKEESISH